MEVLVLCGSVGVGVDPLVRIVQMVLLVLVQEQVHYSDHRS